MQLVFATPVAISSSDQIAVGDCSSPQNTDAADGLVDGSFGCAFLGEHFLPLIHQWYHCFKHKLPFSWNLYWILDLTLAKVAYVFYFLFQVYLYI